MIAMSSRVSAAYSSSFTFAVFIFIFIFIFNFNFFVNFLVFRFGLVWF